MRDFMVGNVAVGVIVVDGKDGAEAAFADRDWLNIPADTGETFDVLHRLKTSSPLATRFAGEKPFRNTMAGGGADLRRRYII